MTEVREQPAGPETWLAPEPAGLADLVNRLAKELAEARRALTAATQKLGTTSRTLEGRTHELTEAKASLALLLATLDAATEGILALGYLGRAMHYNTRFVEMWRIPPDKLPGLNDSALLAMQLAQVKDPFGFLANVEACKANPDAEQCTRIELTNGRILEWRVMPQRVRGKRIGVVSRYTDVTHLERPAPNACDAQAELPVQAAQATASIG